MTTTIKRCPEDSLNVVFSFEDNFLAVAVTTKPDNFRSEDNFLELAVSSKPDNFRSGTNKPDRSDERMLTRTNVFNAQGTFLLVQRNV